MKEEPFMGHFKDSTVYQIYTKSLSGYNRKRPGRHTRSHKQAGLFKRAGN